jgi:cyclophilin family peptidyl-prolyl cis-trans isomerase
MFRQTLFLFALLGLLAVPALAEDEKAGSEAKAAAAEDKDAAEMEEEVAVVKTNLGTIVIRFYAEDCPKSTANFKKLANDKFYDGCKFHRVIPGFVIQGGDPNSKDADRSNDGQGGPGYTVPAEIKHKHKRGALAAARLPDQVNPKKESSGSQFYIAVKALPSLDGNYTVYGEILEGMDVVDKIVAVRRDARDNPIEPVIMETVRIEKLSKAMKAVEKSKPKEKEENE